MKANINIVYRRIKPIVDPYGLGIYRQAEIKDGKFRMTHHDCKVPREGFWVEKENIIMNDPDAVRFTFAVRNTIAGRATKRGRGR